MILVLALLMLLTATAIADDAKPVPLNVEQCIQVLAGLSSLDWSGQLLGEDKSKRPADAKQYKLGDARFTIAMDISALSPVQTAYQRAQQEFFAEQLPIPPDVPGKPTPPEVQKLKSDQDKAAIAAQVSWLQKPCGVAPGHINISALKLGDGPDQNAIPPSVLAAFSPIIDR